MNGEINEIHERALAAQETALHDLRMLLETIGRAIENIKHGHVQHTSASGIVRMAGQAAVAMTEAKMLAEVNVKSE